MKVRSILIAGIVTIVCLGRVDSQAPKFDKLSDADRKAFGERFEKEIWPLLQRGGKDGCVGCHHAKYQSVPRFAGEPGADFRMLLKEGFLLHNDSGSLYSVVVTRDLKRRMPTGKRPAWNDEDKQVLRRFIEDVDKKQGK